MILENLPRNNVTTALYMQTTTCNGLFVISTMGAAAYKGYQDTIGSPIESETINAMINYAPTAVHTVFGGLFGNMIHREYNQPKRLIAEGAIIFGSIAALETIAGYAIGCGIGALSKIRGGM